MNIREDYIYARQSVDRKDSISIESQIDFCKYELKGGSCKIFKDKGCPGCGTLRKVEFEQFVFNAMREQFRDFKHLRGGEEKANPKLTAW